MTVQSQLHQLRRRIRSYLAFSGAARVILLMVLCAAGSFLIDWWFHLAGATRLFLFLLASAAIGVTVYRRLVAPLLLPLGPEDLSLIVEHHFPDLKESLISAVQFAGRSGARASAESAALMAAVLSEVEEKVKQLPFKRAASFQQPARVVTASVLLSVSALGYSVVNSDLVAVWAKRIVNPYSTAQWPRKTQLEMVGLQKETKIARGDDLEVIVAVRKGSVSRVTLDYVDSKGSKGIRRLKRGPDSNFVTLFPRVTEPLRLQARGGDDLTGWYSIVLVDRPRVEHVKVSVKYPDYTRLPPQAFADGQGDVAAVVGSTVAVHASTDQLLSEAKLVVENGPSVLCDLTSPQELSGELTLEAGFTAYRIEVKNVDGVGNSNPLTFKLQVIPDREPEVRIKGLEAELEYARSATIPLKYLAEDDFGIREVVLSWRYFAPTAPRDSEGPPETQVLPGVEAGSKRIDALHSWGLGAFELKESSSIVFHLEARDDDIVSGPNVGRTRDYTISIVSKAKLEATLTQREQAAVRQLERLRKQQEVTLRRVEGLVDSLATAKPLNLKQQEEHVKAELEQRQLARDTQDLEQQVSSMLDYVRSNGLESYERLAHLQDMQDTLKDLGDQDIPAAAKLLQESRAEGKEATPEVRKMASAAERQNQAVEKLNGLLARLGETNDLDRLIHMARSLANKQGRINQTTKELALNLLGKATDDLTEDEKAALQNLARDQERTQQAMKGLEEKMGLFADQNEKENPKLSGQLAAALAEATKDQIRNQMSRIRKGIEDNKLLSILKPQKGVYRDVQKLLDTLRKSKDAQGEGRAQLRKEIESALNAMAETAENQQFVADKLDASQKQKEELEEVGRQLDRLRKQQEETKKETSKLESLDQEKRSARSGSLAKAQRQHRSDAEKLGKETEGMSERMREHSGRRAQQVADAAEKTNDAAKSMKAAEEKLGGGQAGEAKADQEDAEEKLAEAEKLIDEAKKNLAEERTDEMQGLADRQKEFSEEAKRTADRVKKISQSDQARKDEVKSLAERAAASLDDASEEMKKAHQQMQAQEPKAAQDSQQKAQQSMRQAFKNLLDAAKKLSEDERTKKLSKLMAALTQMLNGQKGIGAVVEEAHLKWEGEGSLGRELGRKVHAAAEDQAAVLRDGEGLLAEVEEGGAPVFAWTLETALRSMGVLKARLDRTDVGYESLAQAQGLVESLEMLLAQLQQQSRTMSPMAGQGQRPKPPGPQQGPGPGKLPLLPSLSELKMLRRLEAAIYEATRAIEIENVLNPGRPLAPWKEAKLTELADQQGDLAGIARKLGKLLQAQSSPSQD